jgi:hypothetical protein
MEWLRRNAPLVLLGLALLAAAILLLALGSGQTFFQDTWGFLLYRQDFTVDSFLAPHNEHIAVIPVALEKLEIAVFGMDTAMPERVALTLTLSAAAVVLFVYVRRRIGAWPALFATVLVLFFGGAWPDLLWAFQIAFVGSMLFGIAMLLALDRGDRRGDARACLLLTLSLGFSSLGLPFLAAAAVDVFQRRRSHGLRRAYLAVVPALLFAAWWIGWGHEAERHVTLDNVLSSPAYALEGLAASVEALLGLSKATAENAAPPEWGLPLLIALIALAVYGQVRRPGVSVRFWPVAAAVAASWLLAAFNSMPGREAYQTRYMYAGGVFVLLLAAELLRGVRLGRRGLIAMALVAVAAVSSNLALLREGSRWLRDQAVLTRADLAAIEIARRTVDPNFALSPEVAGTGSLAIVGAGSYLRAERAHGSPAYTAAELARAPEAGRRQADIVLSQALPLSTKTYIGARPSPRGDCRTLPGGGESPGIRLLPGITRIEVAPGPAAEFNLRRFAIDEYPVPTEGAPGGSTTLLEIPPDAAPQPWRLQVKAKQRVTVCR